MRQAAGRWLGVAVGLALGVLVLGAAEAQSLSDRARADLAKSVAEVETGKPTKVCTLYKQKAASRQFPNLEAARAMLASGRYELQRCEMEGATREGIVAYLRDSGQSFVAPTITPTSITVTGGAMDITPGKRALICHDTSLSVATAGNCFTGYTEDKRKKKEVSAKVDGYRTTALLITDSHVDGGGAGYLRNVCDYMFGGPSEREAAIRKVIADETKRVLTAGMWTSAAEYLGYQDRFKTYADMDAANRARQEAACSSIKSQKKRFACQGENNNPAVFSYGMARENRIRNGRDTAHQALHLLYDISARYPDYARWPETQTLANIVRVGPVEEFRGLDLEALVAARPRWIVYSKNRTEAEVSAGLYAVDQSKLRCLQFYPAAWPVVVTYAETGKVNAP